MGFFKNTFCPEESFFQTILGNSPYKARIQRGLTYTDWSGGGQSPAYITEDHLELFLAAPSVSLSDHYGSGEVLFARKFTDEAEELVSQIDDNLGEREARLVTHLS